MSVTTKTESLLDRAVAAIGGSTRSGQLEMAEAVAQTLASGSQTLLVQAGTGTGKSIGYAVPAAAFAVDRETPVVLATATLALQRQLVERDLPALAEALTEPLGRELRFAVLKGRSNYVCMDRLRRGGGSDPESEALFETPTSRLGRQAMRLRRWAQQTETGDRDDLDQPVDGRVWGALSVSARECVGAQSCPFGDECFVESARSKARSADLVVTNHAMLAIELQGDATVIPEHGAVVVDEAHELLDRVTTALTRELSESAIERALGRARAFIEAEQAERLRDVAGFLADILADHPVGRLHSCQGELLVGLTAIRDVGHELLAALRGRSEDSPEEAADRTRARAVLSAIHETAAQLIAMDENTVAWIDGEPGRPRVLRSAPLSVRELLSDELFGNQPVVLTSATLGVGGSLDRMADLIGAPADRVCLDVGSPFDYQRQAILYCAVKLPRPGRDGVSEAALTELGDLIEAAGGRTLALFSSWRAVDRAFDTLVERFAARPELPLLRAQRGDPVAGLVREFARVPEASLLGTLSLWQGVDVPGESCILVVIDRIPFPRPDEPLTEARQQMVDRHGGNGFADVSVPRAGLLLAQGAGRLIRSPEDRGVVAVLDPRLARSSYSEDLIACLPPFFLTADGEAVKSALGRLRDGFAKVAPGPV